MSKIALSAPVAGAGTATIKGPETASDIEFQLPPRAGQVMVAGPAFLATMGADQVGVTNNVPVKVALNTAEFDIGGGFNTSAYRYQPSVAGYYQINAFIRTLTTTVADLSALNIYKNGVARNGSLYYGAGITFTVYTSSHSEVIYLNGSTDYLEMYARINGTGTLSFAGGTMSGFLVRPA